MLKQIFLLIFLISSSMTSAQSSDIYAYSFTDINGKDISLEQFRGKKILFVNVASKCGYTPQYEGLQKLHKTYGDKVVIIGFPCNQFMKQEPGDEEKIKDFCYNKYGVEFIMASKIRVKRSGQHPIYKWLTSEKLNGVESSKVSWNFQKYLVDEEGNYIQKFSPGVKPMSGEITDHLK